MSLLVKWAGRSLPSPEIVFFRSLIGVLMVMILMARKRVSFLGGNKKLLCLRGISGFIALILFFHTLVRLPVGTAVLINYTAPIFAALFGIILLGERPGPFLCSMILVSFAGVYLLIGPQAIENGSAVILGLISAVFAAVAYVSMRAIRRGESPLTVMFYFTGVSTVGSAFYLPMGFVWPSAEIWLALIGIGIMSFYGQLWMTISMRRAAAVLVTPFAYATPLFSFLLGWIFLGEQLSQTSLWGACLIILSGSLISVFETKKKTRPPAG